MAELTAKRKPDEWDVADEHMLAWLLNVTQKCPDCGSRDPAKLGRVGPITGPGPDEWFYVDCQHPWHEKALVDA